jgi:hypothetical protein
MTLEHIRSTAKNENKKNLAQSSTEMASRPSVDEKRRLLKLKKNIFVANALMSPFNTQTSHIKPLFTQHHCYVPQKTLYPGGIRTRVFSFLRRVQCPMRHAATGQSKN